VQPFGFVRDAGLAIADMDSDGKSDVVGLFPSGVSVLFGTGTEGLLSGPSEFPLPFPGSDLAVADFNGDGKLDVVATSPHDGLISIFLGGRATIESIVAAVDGIALRQAERLLLSRTLQLADRFLDRGQTRVGVIILQTFIKEVGALERRGRISAEDAASLTALASQVIEGIGEPQ
jgi:hypothetical protein